MLRGTVIKGDGIGRSLGYPTANLDTPKSKVLFTKGVYAAYATLRNKEYKCALVIGDNPWRVEAYLLEYKNSDFYGAKMSIRPLQKVSTIERIDTKEELKQKIIEDIKIVKDFFAEKS